MMTETTHASKIFIRLLETDLDKNHLSLHPFYRLWNEGRLSMPALQDYAKQYYHFVAYFPRLVSQIHAGVPDRKSRVEVLENLYEEDHPEHAHEDMWVQFAEGIGVSRKDIEGAAALPKTKQVIQTMKNFCESSFIEGSAAVLAYEAQISDIAELKKLGLEKHYGIDDEGALKFFEVHGEVDIEHQKTWKRILARYAQTEQQQKKARTALQESLKSLWGLLDGVYELHYRT